MLLGGDPNIDGQTTHSDNMPMSHIGYAHTSPPPAPTINSSILSLPYESCQLGNSNS